MAVTTCGQKELNKDTDISLSKTHFDTNKSHVPTLDKFMSAQGADAYRNKIQPTVKILRRSFKIKKIGLVGRLSLIYVFLKDVFAQSVRPWIIKSNNHSTFAGLAQER